MREDMIREVFQIDHVDLRRAYGGSLSTVKEEETVVLDKTLIKNLQELSCLNEANKSLFKSAKKDLDENHE